MNQLNARPGLGAMRAIHERATWRGMARGVMTLATCGRCICTFLLAGCVAQTFDSAGMLTDSPTGAGGPWPSAGSRLLPSEVAKMAVYSDWRNGTAWLHGRNFPVAEGSLSYGPPLHRETKFAVLPAAMTPDEVSAVLGLLKPQNRRRTFERAPDSVDAMPTEELNLYAEDDIFYHNGEMVGPLVQLMRPIEDRLTAFVRHRYPEVCSRSRERACRPCYSLVRRYLPGERRRHGIHRDGQAIVSVVTSLSDYGSEYSGGLFVAAADPHGRKVLALRKGDAVVHQYDLLHGVDVADESSLRNEGSAPPGERWSWILWYKDSATCEQRGHEWSRDCASAGDMLCQYNMGWRLHLDPHMSEPEKSAGRERYMSAAAKQGFGEAMFQLARTYLGKRDLHGAVDLLRRAMAAGDVDAPFQLAQLTLLGLVPRGPHQSDATLRLRFEAALVSGGTTNHAPSVGAMREAVELFEVAAKAGTSVFRGAEFAQYNLGVAYLYGYGVERSARLASEWFRKCGLPEGMVALAVQANATGHEASARVWQNRAMILGFEERSRKENRDFALFQLHSNWPEGPPRW